MAIADIRANPWLLDYVWASVVQDALTARTYGMADLERSKEWFLNTDFPVKVGPVMDETAVPVIVVSLGNSEEQTAEATIGDINPDGATEDNTSAEWPPMTTPLIPVSYDQATGVLVLREKDIPSDFSVAEGMYVIDRFGAPHEIKKTYGRAAVGVAPGTVADFRGGTIKTARPTWLTFVESSSFRESYQLAVKVGGEPVNTVLLHSVVVFCLLRYKEVLLEARGFERSTFTSSDLKLDTEMSETQPVFARYISLSGYIRQYWPKLVTPKIAVAYTQGRVIAAGPTGTQDWSLDDDSIVLTGRG